MAALKQRRPTPRQRRRPPRDHDAGHAPTIPDLLVFISVRPHGARRRRGRPRMRNPVHAALSLVRHALRDRGAVRRAAGRVPGRRPGDRLRRRHRGALPLRHHVPRRRPPRTTSPPSRWSASARWLAALGGADRGGPIIALGSEAHWLGGAHSVVGPTGGPSRTSTTWSLDLHHLPVRLRGDRSAAHHRRGRRRCVLAPAGSARCEPRHEAIERRRRGRCDPAEARAENEEVRR